MILVTGGTGFIGRSLIRQLVEEGYQVRTLIRPSPHSPNLPRGVPVEVALSELHDERGLRAALVGVDTVFHLAGVERRGAQADLLKTDIQGTQAVVQAAKDTSVNRIFFVSHLGADRASAYPVLKAKAIAEEHIRRSGIDFTIFRSALVFGPNDGFTTGLAQLIHALPFFFLIPGDGQNLIQPLWVEDLTTCLVWAYEDNASRNQTYEVGGIEFLTFQNVVETVIKKMGLRRSILFVSPPFLRFITVILEYIFPSSPVSVFWIDYLATNRTCALDTIPQFFHLMPARFSQRLAYLQGQNWRRTLISTLLRRRIPRKR